MYLILFNIYFSQNVITKNAWLQIASIITFMLADQTMIPVGMHNYIYWWNGL